MLEGRPTRSSGGTATIRRPLFARLALDRQTWQAAAGYGLPFVLVLYLGLKGGGYDAVVRSEVGVAAWWILLLGVVVGVLPQARVPRAAWIGLGLLAAFALWTTIGISWSESSERSATEAARVASLLGMFGLAAFAQGRESIRRTVIGVAAAITLIGVLALLSRLHPQWFPSDETSEAFTGLNRLNYPLNYWNGLASLLAIGVPLLLVIAARTRLVAGSALAAAAIPAVTLAAFYTFSRGGAAEIAIALVVLFALYPRRLELLPVATVAGLGSTLLIAAATQRDALEDNLATVQAWGQADEMIALTIIVCAGVALVQAAVALAARNGIGPRIRIERRQARIATGVAVVVAVVIAAAAGVPGELGDRWDEFKRQPEPSASGAERFESAGGGGRYQLWSAALDANATAPLNGIGPGSFEFWESREGTTPAFARDAHSLYIETLAELGIVGFVLIVALLALILGTGARRAVSGSSLDRRGWAAAATAGCAAFAAAAAVDWAWELTVLPITMLLLAAALLGPSAEPRREDASRFEGGLALLARPVVAFACVLGLIAIVIPLAATSSLRASQDDFTQAQLGSALDSAERAGSIQPYAASPPLQEALVLERQGELAAAADAATAATEHEATNWRTWLVLSRIEAHRGNVEASIDAYRRAKELNPLSPLFQ